MNRLGLINQKSEKIAVAPRGCQAEDGIAEKERVKQKTVSACADPMCV